MLVIVLNKVVPPLRSRMCLALCCPGSRALGLSGELLDAHCHLVVFQQVNTEWKHLHLYFRTWIEAESSWVSGFCALHALSNYSSMWLTKR